MTQPTNQPQTNPTPKKEIEMKKYLLIALAILAIALALSIRSCSRMQQQANRLLQNQNALLDTMHTYKVRDSLNAASVGALQLTISELKQYRAKDVALIKDLNIRLPRVQAIANTSTVGEYKIKTPLVLDDRVFEAASKIAWDKVLHKPLHMDSVRHKFNLHTPYIHIDGAVVYDTLEAQIEVFDTLAQVFHRVPRFKILGIWFGTKGIRQEIVSLNPYTRITAAEYIEVTNRRGKRNR